MNLANQLDTAAWADLSGHAAAALALATGGLDALADLTAVDDIDALVAYSEGLLTTGWVDAASPTGGAYVELVAAIGRRPTLRALDARFSGPLWRQAVEAFDTAGLAGLREIGLDDVMADMVAVQTFEEEFAEV